ncbi:MAG: hypothetical protein A3I89_04350 [Candidatus Harrisonbacteria bacterium RIFCSPLOWO2_02_FULL_41_11]|uniref:Adenylate kinase n=1 Tax=Candidatus Harrisonbacteria bacterium RIFCSPHIGHO2_02_FULL_42_16 TaxID=1798404 RepID=A0A1G1ZIT2_9BACT|nr:MAG: hypothetical protein A3B92_02835 [Candidatus Harrisonbacteria bacterium RIFCSPHIGHO2_02_FULL_42_16]OGY67654.1 MAG: hypothetical protein A3I89_04350 [Candidatus Harrisonbacteria bacterium RIFCSPLOWO2_02_FULL_41_11]
MRKAIIIYGPPGAGKGTQANLIAGKFGMIHFDTGKYIEQVVRDPVNKKDKVIQREKVIFDTGKLCTPSWVLKIVRQKTRELAKAGFGVIFSGSPRTVFETFGDSKNKGIISILEKEYGKKNILLFFLEINPKISILRNKNRKICSVCGTAILYNDTDQHKTCPLCGGKLRKRSVDNPKVFETRIKEYKERTEPILNGLRKKGYKIIKVDGRPLPYKVFASILKKLR